MAKMRILIEADSIAYGNKSIEIEFDDTLGTTKMFANKLKLALEAVEINPEHVAKDIIGDDEA